MPTSLIDIENINPEDFKGLTLEVCVIERKGYKVIVSRRTVLDRERKIARWDQKERRGRRKGQDQAAKADLKVEKDGGKNGGRFSSNRSSQEAAERAEKDLKAVGNRK